MTSDTIQHDAPRPYVELRTGIPYARLISHQTFFAEAVGERFGIDPAHVIPSAGTTGAIESVRNHVLKTSARRSPVLLTVKPGYWRARECFQGLGFGVVDFETRHRGFTLDEAEFAAEVARVGPDVIYLSLPNNPTGAVFDAEALISQIPEEVAITLDLTLPSRELGSGALLSRLYEAFPNRRNLFLLGSTSKSHGTAEHRIGWVVCTSPDDARELRGENRTGISTISIAEGIRHLGRPSPAVDKIDMSFELLAEGTRAGLYEIVEPRKGVRSGYVLTRILEHGATVRERLDARGIKVMWGSEVGLTDEYIRLEMLEETNVKIFVDSINAAPDDFCPPELAPEHTHAPEVSA